MVNLGLACTNYIFIARLFYSMKLDHSCDVLMQMSNNIISCRIICSVVFFFWITTETKDLYEKIILGHLPSLRKHSFKAPVVKLWVIG